MDLTRSRSLSEKSKIRVRVKRQGEELRPTDYFSQSQQQTLLLGLFPDRLSVSDVVGLVASLP